MARGRGEREKHFCFSLIGLFPQTDCFVAFLYVIWLQITKRLTGIGVGVWGTGWESSGDWQSVAVALGDQKVLKTPARKTHL